MAGQFETSCSFSYRALPTSHYTPVSSKRGMKNKPIVMPKFVNEAQEADWWASREGREFVKQKAAGTGKKGGAPSGSRLVGEMNKVASLQIAL